MISPRNSQQSRYSESVVISYSQNQEDVVLSRLVSLEPKGTYVDVGAAHPVYDNVTYALYQAGWRGINIEPMKREADWLKDERPEDRTYEVAVGKSSGQMTLFEAPDVNRGATTADLDLVRRYGDDGQEFQPFEVEVMRLDALLDENHLDVIHVLKIDVEGGEREVIEGASLSRFLPWVVVVEATRPNSTEDVSVQWENLILEAGYTKTLFDGLNNFYVRNDLPEVKKLMSVPANVFDRWKPFEIDDLNRQARDLLHRISEMSRNFDESMSQFELERKAFENSLKNSEEFINSLLQRAEKAEVFARSLLLRAEKAEEYAKSLQDRLVHETGASFTD